MTLEQEILDAVRALPADKQRELIDHVSRLRDEATQFLIPSVVADARLPAPCYSDSLV
jgi:hypothetical protein